MKINFSNNCNNSKAISENIIMLPVHNKIDKFARDNPIIITTEKDAMRIMSHTSLSEIEKYYCYICRGI